jgi:hypothetical protein
VPAGKTSKIRVDELHRRDVHESKEGLHTVAHALTFEHFGKRVVTFSLNVLDDVAVRLAAVLALDRIDLESDDAGISRGNALFDGATPHFVLVEAHARKQLVGDDQLPHAPL